MTTYDHHTIDDYFGFGFATTQVTNLNTPPNSYVSMVHSASTYAQVNVINLLIGSHMRETGEARIIRSIVDCDLIPILGQYFFNTVDTIRAGGSNINPVNDGFPQFIITATNTTYAVDYIYDYYTKLSDPTLPVPPDTNFQTGISNQNQQATKFPTLSQVGIYNNVFATQKNSSSFTQALGGITFDYGASPFEIYDLTAIKAADTNGKTFGTKLDTVTTNYKPYLIYATGGSSSASSFSNAQNVEVAIIMKGTIIFGCARITIGSLVYYSILQDPKFGYPNPPENYTMGLQFYLYACYTIPPMMSDINKLMIANSVPSVTAIVAYIVQREFNSVISFNDAQTWNSYATGLRKDSLSSYNTMYINPLLLAYESQLYMTSGQVVVYSGISATSVTANFKTYDITYMSSLYDFTEMLALLPLIPFVSQLSDGAILQSPTILWMTASVDTTIRIIIGGTAIGPFTDSSGFDVQFMFQMAAGAYQKSPVIGAALLSGAFWAVPEVCGGVEINFTKQPVAKNPPATYTVVTDVVQNLLAAFGDVLDLILGSPSTDTRIMIGFYPSSSYSSLRYIQYNPDIDIQLTSPGDGESKFGGSMGITLFIQRQIGNTLSTILNFISKNAVIPDWSQYGYNTMTVYGTLSFAYTSLSVSLTGILPINFYIDTPFGNFDIGGITITISYAPGPPLKVIFTIGGFIYFTFPNTSNVLTLAIEFTVEIEGLFPNIVLKFTGSYVDSSGVQNFMGISGLTVYALALTAGLAIVDDPIDPIVPVSFGFLFNADFSSTNASGAFYVDLTENKYGFYFFDNGTIVLSDLAYISPCVGIIASLLPKISVKGLYIMFADQDITIGLFNFRQGLMVRFELDVTDTGSIISKYVASDTKMFFEMLSAPGTLMIKGVINSFNLYGGIVQISGTESVSYDLTTDVLSDLQTNIQTGTASATQISSPAAAKLTTLTGPVILVDATLSEFTLNIQADLVIDLYAFSMVYSVNVVVNSQTLYANIKVWSMFAATFAITADTKGNVGMLVQFDVTGLAELLLMVGCCGSIMIKSFSFVIPSDASTPPSHPTITPISAGTGGSTATQNIVFDMFNRRYTPLGKYYDCDGVSLGESCFGRFNINGSIVSVSTSVQNIVYTDSNLNQCTISGVDGSITYTDSTSKDLGMSFYNASNTAKLDVSLFSSATTTDINGTTYTIYSDNAGNELGSMVFGTVSYSVKHNPDCVVWVDDNQNIRTVYSDNNTPTTYTDQFTNPLDKLIFGYATQKYNSTTTEYTYQASDAGADASNDSVVTLTQTDFTTHISKRTLLPLQKSDPPFVNIYAGKWNTIKTELNGYGNCALTKFIMTGGTRLGSVQFDTQYTNSDGTPITLSEFSSGSNTIVPTSGPSVTCSVDLVMFGSDVGNITIPLTQDKGPFIGKLLIAIAELLAYGIEYAIIIGIKNLAVNAAMAVANAASAAWNQVGPLISKKADDIAADATSGNIVGLVSDVVLIVGDTLLLCATFFENLVYTSFIAPLIYNFGPSLWSGVKSIYNFLSNLTWSGTWNAIQSAASAVVNLVENIGVTIGNSLESAGESVVSAISNIGSDILSSGSTKTVIISQYTDLYNKTFVAQWSAICQLIADEQKRVQTQLNNFVLNYIYNPNIHDFNTPHVQSVLNQFATWTNNTFAGFDINPEAEVYINLADDGFWKSVIESTLVASGIPSTDYNYTQNIYTITNAWSGPLYVIKYKDYQQFTNAWVSTGNAEIFGSIDFAIALLYLYPDPSMQNVPSGLFVPVSIINQMRDLNNIALFIDIKITPPAAEPLIQQMQDVLSHPNIYIPAVITKAQLMNPVEMADGTGYIGQLFALPDLKIEPSTFTYGLSCFDYTPTDNDFTPSVDTTIQYVASNAPGAPTSLLSPFPGVYFINSVNPVANQKSLSQLTIWHAAAISGNNVMAKWMAQNKLGLANSTLPVHCVNANKHTPVDLAYAVRNFAIAEEFISLFGGNNNSIYYAEYDAYGIAPPSSVHLLTSTDVPELSSSQMFPGYAPTSEILRIIAVSPSYTPQMAFSKAVANNNASYMKLLSVAGFLTSLQITTIPILRAYAEILNNPVSSTTLSLLKFSDILNLIELYYAPATKTLFTNTYQTAVINYINTQTPAVNSSSMGVSSQDPTFATFISFINEMSIGNSMLFAPFFTNFTPSDTSTDPLPQLIWIVFFYNTTSSFGYINLSNYVPSCTLWASLLYNTQTPTQTNVTTVTSWVSTYLLNNRSTVANPLPYRSYISITLPISNAGRSMIGTKTNTGYLIPTYCTDGNTTTTIYAGMIYDNVVTDPIQTWNNYWFIVNANNLSDTGYVSYGDSVYLIATSIPCGTTINSLPFFPSRSTYMVNTQYLHASSDTPLQVNQNYNGLTIANDTLFTISKTPTPFQFMNNGAGATTYGSIVHNPYSGYMDIVSDSYALARITSDASNNTVISSLSFGQTSLAQVSPTVLRTLNYASDPVSIVQIPYNLRIYITTSTPPIYAPTIYPPNPTYSILKIFYGFIDSVSANNTTPLTYNGVTPFSYNATTTVTTPVTDVAISGATVYRVSTTTDVIVLAIDTASTMWYAKLPSMVASAPLIKITTNVPSYAYILTCTPASAVTANTNATSTYIYVTAAKTIIQYVAKTNSGAIPVAPPGTTYWLTLKGDYAVTSLQNLAVNIVEPSIGVPVNTSMSALTSGACYAIFIGIPNSNNIYLTTNGYTDTNANVRGTYIKVPTATATATYTPPKPISVSALWQRGSSTTNNTLIYSGGTYGLSVSSSASAGTQRLLLVPNDSVSLATPSPTAPFTNAATNTTLTVVTILTPSGSYTTNAGTSTDFFPTIVPYIDTSVATLPIPAQSDINLLSSYDIATSIAMKAATIASYNVPSIYISASPSLTQYGNIYMNSATLTATSATYTTIPTTIAAANKNAHFTVFVIHVSTTVIAVSIAYPNSLIVAPVYINTSALSISVNLIVYNNISYTAYAYATTAPTATIPAFPVTYYYINNLGYLVAGQIGDSNVKLGLVYASNYNIGTSAQMQLYASGGKYLVGLSSTIGAPSYTILAPYVPTVLPTTTFSLSYPNITTFTPDPAYYGIIYVTMMSGTPTYTITNTTTTITGKFAALLVDSNGPYVFYNNQIYDTKMTPISLSTLTYCIPQTTFFYLDPSLTNPSITSVQSTMTYTYVHDPTKDLGLIMYSNNNTMPTMTTNTTIITMPVVVMTLTTISHTPNTVYSWFNNTIYSTSAVGNRNTTPISVASLTSPTILYGLPPSYCSFATTLQQTNAATIYNHNAVTDYGIILDLNSSYTLTVPTAPLTVTLPFTIIKVGPSLSSHMFMNNTIYNATNFDANNTPILSICDLSTLTYGIPLPTYTMAYPNAVVPKSAIVALANIGGAYIPSGYIALAFNTTSYTISLVVGPTYIGITPFRIYAIDPSGTYIMTDGTHYNDSGLNATPASNISVSIYNATFSSSNTIDPSQNFNAAPIFTQFVSLPYYTSMLLAANNAPIYTTVQAPNTQLVQFTYNNVTYAIANPNQQPLYQLYTSVPQLQLTSIPTFIGISKLQSTYCAYSLSTLPNPPQQILLSNGNLYNPATNIVTYVSQITLPFISSAKVPTIIQYSSRGFATSVVPGSTTNWYAVQLQEYSGYAYADTSQYIIYDGNGVLINTAYAQVNNLALYPFINIPYVAVPLNPSQFGQIINSLMVYIYPNTVYVPSSGSPTTIAQSGFINILASATTTIQQVVPRPIMVTMPAGNVAVVGGAYRAMTYSDLLYLTTYGRPPVYAIEYYINMPTYGLHIPSATFVNYLNITGSINPGDVANGYVQIDPTHVSAPPAGIITRTGDSTVFYCNGAQLPPIIVTAIYNGPLLVQTNAYNLPLDTNGVPYLASAPTNSVIYIDAYLSRIMQVGDYTTGYIALIPVQGSTTTCTIMQSFYYDPSGTGWSYPIVTLTNTTTNSITTLTITAATIPCVVGTLSASSIANATTQSVCDVSTADQTFYAWTNSNASWNVMTIHDYYTHTLFASTQKTLSSVQSGHQYFYFDISNQLAASSYVFQNAANPATWQLYNGSTAVTLSHR